MAATSERRYHHGNLRETLLRAAEDALARGEALSLRELAREAGVSHAAPRRHFADRQALLDALALEGFERLGRALEAAAAPGRAAWRTRFRRLAHAYVRFATEHAALLDLMYAAKHAPGGDLLHEAAARAFGPPVALVAEGQAAGEVAGGDLHRLTTVVFSTVHGLAALANAGMLGDQPLDALVDEAAKRLLAGLRP